jgi:putative ATPase
VEDGTVVLVGATTENPSFRLNSALLSRCHVYVLNPFSKEEMEQMLKRAEKRLDKNLPLTEEARDLLIKMADGDARYLLNMVEVIFDLWKEGGEELGAKDLKKVVEKRALMYDQAGEAHYNLISALHKSLRGSDVQASLYWAARMLVSGEDPLYVLRRLTRFAVEDVGLSDPNALTQALNCWEMYERLGSPEGEIGIVYLVIYLANAPKSNSSYTAFGKVMREAKDSKSYMPPKHILNAPTDLMKGLGYGKGYQYDHDSEHGFSGQNYFPDEMGRREFYYPKEVGFEREIKKRMDYWENLRKKKTEG